MESNQKDEQLIKQLDICKKLFSESKFTECLKVLTKLKDASAWSPAVVAKLQCNALVIELHKNKFVSSNLDNLDRAVKSFSQSFNAGVFKELTGSEYILLYNISLICFYLQKYDSCLMFLDKLFNGKSTDSSLPIGPARLDSMNCEFDLKYNVALLWCEACIRSIDMAENAHTVLSWLETKLASEKATCKEAKLLIDKLWYRFHLIKSNLYLLNGNMKACKKDIRSLSSTSTFNHGVPTGFVKANYEYMRKSFIKSMKVLQIQQFRPFTETGECIPMMYYNNLGCLHYRMGKPALGIHYVKKAFNELEKMQTVKSGKKDKNHSQNSGSSSLYSVSALKNFELHYNLGMQLLAAEMPDQAFESFFNAVQLYYCNPKLWFRLAQCCIVKYRKTEKENEADDINFHSVGQGIHHKLVLTSRSVKSQLFGDDSANSGRRDAADIQSAAFPAASLGFGALCIENVLMLITKYQGNAASSKPFGPMKETELKHLRSHALASGAYINLGLEDYMKALRYCNMALSDEKILGSIKYSVTMYQAEALMNLGRLNLAITNLKAMQVDDLDLRVSPYETNSSSGGTSGDKSTHDTSVDLQESGDGSSINSSSNSLGNISETNQSRLYPSSSLLASSYQYINLASAYSIEKNYEVSRQYLNSAASTLGKNRSKLPVECVMLAAYIELCHSNESLGIEILQRRQIPNYNSLTSSNKL